MMLAAKSKGQGGGDRRRPPRARGGGGLNEQGMDVTVLHVMPTLMERQLDPAAGTSCSESLEARGIKVMTKANTKADPRRERVEASSWTDGTRINPGRPGGHGGGHPAQCVATGQGPPGSPSIAALSSMTQMRTSTPRSTRWASAPRLAGMCYGLVAPLYDMANVAGGAALRRRSTAASCPVATATAQGHRASTSTRPVISPRATTARKSCCATPGRRLQAADPQGRSHHRHGALWRNGRWAWFYDMLKRRPIRARCATR
jgi:nitrite reductase (NADH) large subunit